MWRIFLRLLALSRTDNEIMICDDYGIMKAMYSPPLYRLTFNKITPKKQKNG